MLRRSLFGPRFKAKSLSISWQRKNPDRPPKLRDVKKQVKAVQESQSPIQLEKEEEEEGAKAVQESQSPIQLEKEEEEEEAKAVQESQSPIQLKKEEEEEAKAVKPCEVCGGAAGSHPSVVCPYLHDVPWNVTSVGEGYKIACWFCWKGQYCRHLKRYAIRLSCMKCGANGLHTFWDCPERRGKGIEMPSVRRVKLIGTSSVRPGMSQLRRPRWLMGSEAANYTASVEDLYEKMLVKIETLTRLVEQSFAKVLEQENHNSKLRYKAARSAGLE